MYLSFGTMFQLIAELHFKNYGFDEETRGFLIIYRYCTGSTVLIFILQIIVFTTKQSLPNYFSRHNFLSLVV